MGDLPLKARVRAGGIHVDAVAASIGSDAAPQRAQTGHAHLATPTTHGTLPQTSEGWVSCVVRLRVRLRVRGHGAASRDAMGEWNVLRLDMSTPNVPMDKFLIGTIANSCW